MPTIVDSDSFSFADTVVSPVGIADTDAMAFTEVTNHKTASSTSGSGCVVTIKGTGQPDIYTPPPV